MPRLVHQSAYDREQKKLRQRGFVAYVTWTVFLNSHGLSHIRHRSCYSLYPGMSAFRPGYDSGNILGAVVLEIPHTTLGMCSHS